MTKSLNLDYHFYESNHSEPYTTENLKVEYGTPFDIFQAKALKVLEGWGTQKKVAIYCNERLWFVGAIHLARIALTEGFGL